MCFMVSCPYVPPHEFNIDFPHLMLRYRAAERRRDAVLEGFRKLVPESERAGGLAVDAPAAA